jgi:hypothetical protein
VLRIDKHIKGYIDFYFGPENLRQIVDNESTTSPNKLLIDCKALIRQLSAQGYDKKRERYIEKMLTAMRTSIELLNGVEMSIKDQFLKLYDVDLKPVNESELDNLKEEYNEAYSGPGSLESRMSKLRITRKVPESNIHDFFKKALEIVKKKTEEFFPDILPENEYITISLVDNNDNQIKWACYEWYLGDYTSRLEINPNYEMYWTVFLLFASHEGYPGHHTEFSIKEQRLYHGLHQFEHSILILHSPKLIISEGIANTAISVLFSSQEVAEIGLREFCQDAPKEFSLEELVLQDKVKRKIPLFWYNFAYHALVDNYSDDKLMRYGKNVEMFGEEGLRNEIKRLSNPTYSKNAFMYNLGTEAIEQKYGNPISTKDFRNLLINPILPSDLK